MVYGICQEGDHRNRITVPMMMRVLGVSISGYYAWVRRVHSTAKEGTPRGRRPDVMREVVEVFDAHNGFAGSRTIHAHLAGRGINIRLYAVRKIMAELDLSTNYRTPFTSTTVPDPHADPRRDLLKRRFYPWC